MATLTAHEREPSGVEHRVKPAQRATPVRRLTQARIVIGTTVLSFSLPALWDVLSDPTRAYGYLAADAFYYFTIAVNWVEFKTPAFDQIHTTNGFHPLWQWLLTLTYAAQRALGFSRLALVPMAVVICLLMMAAAMTLLGLLRVRDGRISPAFVLLPVGVWPLLVSPLWWYAREHVQARRMFPLFGTAWNLSNGLESALLLLLFAWVAHSYVKRPADSTRRALVFGLLLGALSLARLDHAIYALALAGLPLVYHLARRQWRRASLAAWALLAWSAVLGVYFAYNLLVVGRAMPVSGAVKSTFPVVNRATIAWLLSLPSLPIGDLMYALGRIGSIVFSAVAALLYFPFALRLRKSLASRGPVLRDGHGRFSELMLLTALGTLALAAYDTLFVVEWHIGEWYAPVAALFVALFVVQVAERLADSWRFPAARWLGWAVVLLLLVGNTTYFWKLHRVLAWGSDYANFCLRQSAKVVRHYGAEPPKLLSRDDGIVGFATGFPTTAAIRLALDVEAVEASQSGRFERLMAERGIDRVTSQHYLLTRGFRVGERSKRVQAYAAAVLMAPPSRTYEVEYVDGWFGILRAVEPMPPE